MKIRTKITAVVIPILFVTLGISGLWAYLSATSGITKIALELLVNKVEVLENVFAGNSKCRFAITIPERKMNTTKNN